MLNYHIMSLSLNLALKHLEDGNIELAKHCVNEAGQALDEMAKVIADEQKTQNAN